MKFVVQVKRDTSVGLLGLTKLNQRTNYTNLSKPLNFGKPKLRRNPEDHVLQDFKGPI